ncbi:hypothetical protein HPB47_014663 [Ixodes persulcatus]|uniref:Uncharacterized protein n=1 Tax=Ixodes persulcatus TaxID=34615 RepID=A0AC60QZ08_IXOPE|nr:hypothetical protein HPB47_014663 [Ixodes persulcatus]
MAVNMLRLTVCRGTSFSRFQARAFLSALSRQQAPLTSFVASQKLAPYQPQVTTVRLASADANYVNIWKAERLLAASLLAIIPGAFMFPNAVMDSLLAISVTMHVHWGVETIVVDYVRPSIFGAVIPKVAVGAVYALSISALVGLLYFNFTDVGIVKAVQLVWSL